MHYLFINFRVKILLKLFTLAAWLWRSVMATGNWGLMCEVAIEQFVSVINWHISELVSTRTFLVHGCFYCCYILWVTTDNIRIEVMVLNLFVFSGNLLGLFESGPQVVELGKNSVLESKFLFAANKFEDWQWGKWSQNSLMSFSIFIKLEIYSTVVGCISGTDIIDKINET